MKIFYLIPFLICALCANAQNWAPDSAVWHYDLHEWASAGYTKILVDGDSVINGQPVRVLRKYQYRKNMITGSTSSSFVGSEYTYEDSNRVYYYRMGRFFVLYDFNAEAGDTWEVAGFPIALCDSTAFVTVDSVGFKYVNNDTLKVLYMQNDLNKTWNIRGEVIEKIGGTGYMFPEQQCVSDLTEGGPIRCYSDPEFGLFQTSISDCDFLSTGYVEIEEPAVIIYPIPASDVLYINFDNNNFSSYTFFDMAGKKIFNALIEDEVKFLTIDINHLPAGIYHLKIERKSNKGSISKKVLIQ